MFAQLGNIIFENSKSFNDYSNRGSATYAEHLLLDGKPRLQRTGNSLQELQLSIRLHASFCNPLEELTALKTAKNNGEILPLLWGNGNLEGDFVITELGEQIEDADKQGNVFCYVVDLSLKEYVTPDKLQAIQSNDRSNAKAVGDKKPVVKKKINPATCPQTISGTVSKISNHADAINVIVLQKGGGGTTENLAKIRGHNNAIQLLCADINKRDADPASCLKDYPNISQAAASVKNNAFIFNLDLTAAPQRIPPDNNLLLSSVKNLKVACRSLTNQTITRK